MTMLRRQSGNGSHVLLVLAAVFFVTGLSRVGMGVVEVLAQETLTQPSEEPNPPPEAVPDPGDLFAALQARAADLADQERQLDARARALQETERELQDQLQRLAQAEADLAATLRLTESAAEDDLRHLTTVFEAMKPAHSAELFAQMDVEFAAGFISRLRPEIAGEVLSGLDPLVAYGISAVLAGRHARTPRN